LKPSIYQIDKFKLKFSKYKRVGGGEL